MYTPHIFIMTIFETAMNDIFGHTDFLERCSVDGINYNCICSALKDEIAYLDTGSENPAMFTLDIKLPLEKHIKINDKVMFREVKYRVSSVDFDSANVSIKLHLIEDSTK